MEAEINIVLDVDNVFFGNDVLGQLVAEDVDIGEVGDVKDDMVDDLGNGVGCGGGRVAELVVVLDTGFECFRFGGGKCLLHNLCIVGGIGLALAAIFNHAGEDGEKLVDAGN